MITLPLHVLFKFLEQIFILPQFIPTAMQHRPILIILPGPTALKSQVTHQLETMMPFVIPEKHAKFVSKLARVTTNA
jgi:hypothetical protein